MLDGWIIPGSYGSSRMRSASSSARMSRSESSIPPCYPGAPWRYGLRAAFLRRARRAAAGPVRPGHAPCARTYRTSAPVKTCARVRNTRAQRAGRVMRARIARAHPGRPARRAPAANALAAQRAGRARDSVAARSAGSIRSSRAPLRARIGQARAVKTCARVQNTRAQRAGRLARVRNTRAQVRGARAPPETPRTPPRRGCTDDRVRRAAHPLLHCSRKLAYSTGAGPPPTRARPATTLPS